LDILTSDHGCGKTDAEWKTSNFLLTLRRKFHIFPKASVKRHNAIDLMTEVKKTSKIGDMSKEELELLVERKILEILGDPDYGLDLREEIKEKLKDRLKDPTRIAHKEVMERLGES